MRGLKGWACVWVVGLSLAACGSSDDAGLSGSDAGSGGSAGSGTGGGNTGGGNTGGGNTGGVAGSGTGGGNTGGVAGSGTGGGNTGGASTGGAAGSGTGGASTGGAAGSGIGGASTGGAAGSGTGGSGTGGSGGVTFINNGPCPDSPPTPGTSCPGFAMCCYQAGATPFVCTGGSGTNPHWSLVNNRECCPAATPATGSQCNTPGAITCCYPSGGLFCNTQPNPDEWAPKSGCN